MKKIVKRIWGKCPDRWDILGMAGALCLGVGVFKLVGLAWVWVFAGAVLVIVAVTGAAYGVSNSSR